ncbi:amidohydrolase [Pygmaiobacter massiliensis]|uniref:amidohydrolase n=1 Tax=Pygmaiobacter massiliensis TaxID=1917873 RepID=UPI00289A2025|nr:amidohydrolase [Pygmaiobacter massiliensis]
MLFVKSGNIHTMEPTGTLKADLLAVDGKIVKIAPNLPVPEGAEVWDAIGLEIYPGFIDPHSHIGISEDKIGSVGDDCNEKTNPLAPSLRALDAINPMDSAFHNAVAAGITGVMVGPGSSNVVGGQFAFIKTDGRSVEKMTLLAPAAMKIAFGENPKKDYGGSGKAPMTRMGIAALLREELFRAQRYLESQTKGEGEPDFKLECYRPVFEGQIPLKAHVHRADDILTAIRIAKEFHLGLTLDHCTEGHLIVQEIAESGFPAIVGPSLASRSKIEVEEADFKTAGVLDKARVLVALTTDHPVTRLQYLPICAALAAKEGMGHEAALRAITINAARICRLENRLGSLKPGKDADFIITDGDPLEIKTQVLATVMNGKVVYRKKDGKDIWANTNDAG